MLPINTIRYGTDEFAFNKQVLLKPNVAWDMTDMTACQGFTISFTDSDTSSTGLVFSIDGSLKTLDTAGNAVDFSGSESADDIALNGNTPAQLQALTSVPAFAGKSVIPIIGMVSESEATDFPKIKISAKASKVTDTFEKITETAPRDISYDGSVSTIMEINPSISKSGNGAVDVKVALKTCASCVDGEWSEYMSVDDAIGQVASHIKFKITSTVQNIGSDRADVSSISIQYANGNARNSKITDDVTEIYTVTEDFENAIGYCQAVLKHGEIIDGNINAYVSFKTAPQKRERIQIGMGDGSKKSYTLGLNGTADTGIDHKSIKLYQGNIPVGSFDFNTATGIVSLTATNNEPVTASYAYGYEEEVFCPMSKGETVPYGNGKYATYYSYAVGDNNKTVSNMKFVLDRTGGSVVDEDLGTATGNKQIVVLAHTADEESIQCNADWSYDYSTRLLTFVAPVGTSVKASYEWKADSITLNSFVAGWSLK